MGMPSRRPFLYHSLLSDILNRRSRKIIFTAVRRGCSTLLFYILLCYKSTLIFLLTKRHRTNYNNSIRIQFLDCTGDDPVLRLFMRRKNTAQGAVLCVLLALAFLLPITISQIINFFQHREPSETTEKGRFQQSAKRKIVAKSVFKINFWK